MRSYEDPSEEDYLMVADTLGVNRSTARCILSRHIREVDDDIKQCLDDVV